MYLNNTYAFEAQAVIINVGQDERGDYVILDKTIFYPQGGGQPSDQGVMKSKRNDVYVSHVRQVEDQIRHYVSAPVERGSEVSCQIDQARRLLNARYHTAAHLLSNVVEVKVPNLKAIKGHSFPGEGYVEFQGEGQINSLELESALNEVTCSGTATTVFDATLQEFERLYYKLPYSIPENKAFRVMQIGSYMPVPCGGTHVARTSEIGSIKLTKIKYKEAWARISYEVL